MLNNRAAPSDLPISSSDTDELRDELSLRRNAKGKMERRRGEGMLGREGSSGEMEIVKED